MQKNLEILNSNAPIKQKSKAVNELTQFKSDIEEFVSKPMANHSSDINDKNVKYILGEIQQKLKSYEITCIEDVQQLYVLKQRLMKCNEIIKSVKPNVTVNDGSNNVSVTDKLKKHLSLASVLSSDIFDWTIIEQCFVDECFPNIINKEMTKDLLQVDYYIDAIPRNQIGKKAYAKRGHYVLTYGNPGINYATVILDSTRYFMSLFFQYDKDFLAAYYIDDILHIVSNKGIMAITDNEGLEINPKSMTIINDIINYINDFGS